MSLAPDIALEEVAIGGTALMPVRVYYRPRCLRCGWEMEPFRNKEEAHIEAGVHLRMACFSTSTGDRDDEISGAPGI